MRKPTGARGWLAAGLLLALCSGPALGTPPDGDSIEFLEFLEYLGTWDEESAEESWVDLVDDRTGKENDEASPGEVQPEEVVEVVEIEDHA